MFVGQDEEIYNGVTTLFSSSMKTNKTSGSCLDRNFRVREDFKKKKTEKSDIVQKGRVGWTPKPYF